MNDSEFDSHALNKVPTVNTSNDATDDEDETDDVPVNQTEVKDVPHNEITRHDDDDD